MDFDLISLSLEDDATLRSYLSSLTSFFTFFDDDLDLEDFLDLLETASSSLLLLSTFALTEVLVGGVGVAPLIGVAKLFVFSAIIDRPSSSFLTGLGFN